MISLLTLKHSNLEIKFKYFLNKKKKDQKIFNGTTTQQQNKSNRVEKVNGSTSPSRQSTITNGVGSLSVNGDESEENVTMLPPPKAGLFTIKLTLLLK